MYHYDKDACQVIATQTIIEQIIDLYQHMEGKLLRASIYPPPPLNQKFFMNL